MRRIRITISYDGTHYHGWQVQRGLPTIQQTLEDIISGMEGRPVHVASSGRTDAGVHAYGQVAAFNIENPIPCDNLRRAVNRLLPRDIRVTDVRETHAGFNPRHDAVAKTYEYRIYRREICSPFEHRFVFHHPYPLDESRMNAAARLLEGKFDFTAFAASDDQNKLPKVRTIFSSLGESQGERWIYRVRGTGFLKQMVRNIIGVLVQVGKGTLAEMDVRARLVPGCGIPPGPTSPASGLFLLSVEYPEGGVTHQLETG